MNSTAPERRRLAEGPFASVEACPCGVLHVSLGPLTLRLRADVVESIWLTLGEALARVTPLPHDPRFGVARAQRPS
ncbi:MAG: hypothetical protein JNL38_31700 [Myxococcales bacterium]|nr:hypothetical protein [Myxococcales bacterium]